MWRSGIGVTRDGALVYVGGPSLAITSLANLLVDAGAVRGMELDINPDWVQYSTYAGARGAPVSGGSGTSLLSSMAGNPWRYFESWWIRDFFTMSVRRGPRPPPARALPLSRCHHCQPVDRRVPRWGSSWRGCASPPVARARQRPTLRPPRPTAPPVTTTTLEQPGWTVVSESQGVALADRRTVHLADGNVVTIYRFRADRTSFALHAGSEDPPGAATSVGAAAGPAVTRAEAPRLIAAFNGGFKAASGSGGFEAAGHVVIALRRGFASLVIDDDGDVHVGVWGQGLPYPGERIRSVRQNLQPLVVSGRPSPVIGDLASWGVTLGGVPQVARSALGQDARGNLLYAASMHALPADLATALVGAGAVRAMELDINPYWVQLASTPRPGGPLVAGIPNQERPGSQFVVGWTRDFVTVLARR